MPAGFHDIRLPVDIEQGAKGGPQFKTTVLGSISGQEQRNLDWQYARCMWNIAYGIRDRDSFMETLDFFYSRRGRAYAFRFKDWMDYTSGSGFTLEGDIIGNRSALGIGDDATTAYQIYKYYADDVLDYARKITRPIASTVAVYIDDVLKTVTTHYTVNDATGVITFTTPPVTAEVLTVYYEFDVPVRFDIDKLEVELTWWNAGSVPDITIIEVRE